MFTPNPSIIRVGDTVVLVKSVRTYYGTFHIGHRFKVVGEGERGFDLEDDDGNRLGETCLIRDHYVKVQE